MDGVTRPDAPLATLTARYRHLRTVTASLGPVGEDTAREHVRWLLKGYTITSTEEDKTHDRGRELRHTHHLEGAGTEHFGDRPHPAGGKGLAALDT
jgi:hypothetical protein